MRNTILKYFIAATFLGVLLNSCSKKLDINPQQSLDASQAFATVASTEAAINSVYALLKSSSLYGRDQFVIADALGDMVFANGRGNRFQNENANAPANHMIHWNNAYQAINELNLILDNINTVPGASSAHLARWEGELKFLRALLYFDLVKAYAYIPTFVVPTQDKGGVVLTLTGFNSATAAINYFPSRATTAAVYSQIMADLYSSLALLSNANKGVYFASKHAALALGSRVALYAGNYQRADSFATAAIAIGTGGVGALTTTANHVSEWRNAVNRESIFEVRFATAQEAFSIAFGLQGAITNFPNVAALGNPNAAANGGFGPLVPNLKLLTDLGITAVPAPSSTTLGFGSTIPVLTKSNDVRNKLYEVGINVGGRWIECTKYLGKSGGPGIDNIPVLRWAELYLNRAEARAKLATPDVVGANQDLNVIRSNRIVGFTTPPDLTGQALIDEILKQRYLEFAFEGQRYWDMKRNGLPIVKVLPAVNLPATTFTYNARIPLGEVDGNPNMVQNFGY